MSEERKRARRRIATPRELLLVEVERYCLDPLCGARNAVGLTKEEARSYEGFTCERCERRWDDALTERDVPEWWEDLKITSLEGLRPARREAEGDEREADEGPVERMSEAWRERRASSKDGISDFDDGDD